MDNCVCSLRGITFIWACTNPLLVSLASYIEQRAHFVLAAFSIKEGLIRGPKLAAAFRSRTQLRFSEALLAGTTDKLAPLLASSMAAEDQAAQPQLAITLRKM